MGIIKCVVPGCEDRRSPRHRFPVFDQELYEEWLKRIGNKELVNLDPKFVGSNKRICSVHFSSHCRIPNSSKLKNRSLPTLLLPEFKEKPCEDNSILKYPYRTQTISRTELIQYIKDFKADRDDGAEIEHLGPSVLSVPVTCGPHSFSSRCATLQNSLPVNTSEADLANTKTTLAVDTGQVDCSAAADSDDDQVGDCEPVTIDFTYLMEITSLPDTPLIEESTQDSVIQELPPVALPKLAADNFQRQGPSAPHGNFRCNCQ